MSRQSKSPASTAVNTAAGDVTASIWYPSPLSSRRSDSSTSRWSSAIRTWGALGLGFITLSIVSRPWSFVLCHWSAADYQKSEIRNQNENGRLLISDFCFLISALNNGSMTQSPNGPISRNPPVHDDNDLVPVGRPRLV